MQKVSTTRMELLAKKAQIALARQGRELLEEKRTALMREFLRVADRVYVMNKGQIVYEGTPAGLEADEEIKRRYLGVA